MSEISLVHTSGGLLGDVVVDALRQPDVEGDTRFLADIATFGSADGAAPSKAQYEGDLEAAFRTGQAIWSAYAEELSRGMDVSRLRERLLQPLLTVLGFSPVYQRAHLQAGGQAWAVSHLGWPGVSAPPIQMVANPDLDDRAGGKRSPHEELQGFLNASPIRWGIVTNGRVLRLLRDYHHTRSRGFVEFGLSAIFEAASMPDFLALWRLCHASRFRPLDETEPTGEPVTRLEQLYHKALTAGVAAGKRLQPQVREAIEALANGLLDANPDLRASLHEQQEVGRHFYRELLTVLYRVLFLLFAEQRGMLRAASPLYDETYSLTRLRARVEANDAEPRRRDLWEGLKTTFRIFGNEDLASAVGVYPYNGQLFDLARTPLTTGAMCFNKAVLDAIRALTTVPVGKVRMYVDYRNLGVEELGTVYESLLDYTLTIASEPVQVDNRLVRAGQAYLAPLSIERADLASYYTSRDLVDLLLARSLDPMIEERLNAATSPETQEAALLGMRIIDPACGSAAILVGALDRIAYAVARVRSAPLEPRDIELAHARRDVLQRCIYGTLVFPAVAAVERFSILILRETDPTATLRASMLNFGVEDATTAPYRSWSRDDLAAVSPRTHSILSTNNTREIDLALELHNRFGTLDFIESDGSNPWELSYATLFNATYARRDGLLLRPVTLLSDGFVMQPDKTFVHPDGRVAVPVYEGQMANRWDHRARTFEGYKGPNKYGKKPDIAWVSDKQHANPDFEIEPRYWMMEKVAEARVTAVAGNGLILATRDIARAWTDRRAVRVALLGRAPTTHTLPVLVTTRANALPITALLNSMTFDFLARIHMPGGHVTPWVLSQCAAPVPNAFSDEVPILSEEMSITSKRLSEATKFTVYEWDPQRRAALDARLDALVARAYGLALPEYEQVLDHFVLLKRLEEDDEKIGEYRSKRLRLEAFEDIGGGR